MMKFTATETTWVLVPGPRPQLVEIALGAMFASAAERAMFTDRIAALAALAALPAPFPSWTLDEDAGEYLPPVPEPSGGDWRWNEDAGDWIDMNPVYEPININEADSATLQTLSGVSSARANSIIAGRPWDDPLDMASIGGISTSMIEGWMADPGLEM
jgi:hypothetical protein